MAVYDLERLSVCVIEDNVYVRRILARLLRQLRVGRIELADNGEEAIANFKAMAQNPAMRAELAPDIIISDLVMVPVNGLLLLRWLRGAKESFNRMVPFIMLSGAADQDYVTASRDLGCTEFLAKPFSALTVYKKLLEVIDYPRQFIATQAYFGPDRRRKADPISFKERRVRTDDDVTIVYSSNRLNKPTRPSDVWSFRLPNRLRDKVTNGVSTGVGEIPTGLIEQAEEALERASLDFTEWAREYIGQLTKLCTEARESYSSRAYKFSEINLLAHELRGQGGTFGYPLITMFGKMLYMATLPDCRTDDNAVEIVKAHIDAMRAVIREKVAGDGGTIGRSLLAALEKAIAKNVTMV